MVVFDQDRPPCVDDDGVVRYGDEGDDEKDHEVAEDFQTGAEPEEVHFKPGQRDDRGGSSGPSWEQPS